MAFDIITGLTRYAEVTDVIMVPTLAEEIISKYVPARNRFGYDGMATGIKIANLIQYSGTKADLKGCCDDQQSTDPFVQVQIPVACVAREKGYCMQDLDAIRSRYNWEAGQESIGRLATDVADALRVANASAINDLLINGVSAANGGTDPIDGLVQQLDGKAVTKAYTTGSIYTVIQNAIASLPADAYNWGGEFLVFIGRDVALKYQTSLVFANLFHYNAGTQPLNGEEYMVPGLDGIRVIATKALNGVNTDGVHQAFVIPSGLMLSAINEDSLAKIFFHKCACAPVKFQWYIQGLVGWAIAKPEDCVSFTFTDAVMANAAGIPVEIVAPIDDTTGGVSTTATV